MCEDLLENFRYIAQKVNRLLAAQGPFPGFCDLEHQQDILPFRPLVKELMATSKPSWLPVTIQLNSSMSALLIDLSTSRQEST